MPPETDGVGSTGGAIAATTIEPFADLFAEAARQLTICNSCRYCEGYCAVFPALERRNVLSSGDITQLANLCHDCRACLHACMYSPPHEFAINPPKILSEIRSRTWDHGPTPAAWPDEAMAPASGRRQAWLRTSVLGAFAGVLALMVVLAAATEGLSALWAPHRSAASPYDVISYPALLIVMAIPFVWSAVGLGRAGLRYWRGVRGPLTDLWHGPAWRGALVEAAEMRYMKGGGADCTYPTEAPSPGRRYLHGAVAYGFLLCLLSTVSAGVLQDILGSDPPYPPLSVPVVSGTLGGIGLVVGSIGLMVMKKRSDPVATADEMKARDYNLLVALTLLGATGLGTLFLRDTAAFGPVLVIHLAAVAVCFAVAPYTKFNHVLHRLLALVLDNLERFEARPAAGSPK